MTAGCRKLMVTGSDLVESEKAVQLARDYRESDASNIVDID